VEFFCVMLKLALCAALVAVGAGQLEANAAPGEGIASWYGETHRGKLMANGKKFNPEKLTAASWFYPLGTRVKVTSTTKGKSNRSVVRSVYVTITDRGPAQDLVREGRIIDLAHGAFRRLADPDLGLISVTVQPVGRARERVASLTGNTVTIKKAA
jgi:rare lipoprotein A